MRTSRPPSDLERELFDAVAAGRMKNWEAGKRLGVTASAIFNRMKRLNWKKGEKALPTPFGNPPSPGPASNPTAPAPALPRSLDEILKGPSLSPTVDAPAVAPQNKTEGSIKTPADTATPGASASPAPEIDMAAAKMGKRIALKIRAGIMGAALSYYGIDSKDPEIQDLLPKDMRTETRGSDQSILEMILDENPEKTQKLGKIFRGWLGLLAGSVIETIDCSGTVRQIAVKKGIELPEERIARILEEKKKRQAEADAAAGTRQDSPASPAEPAPAPAKKAGFDLNATLGQINHAALTGGR